MLATCCRIKASESWETAAVLAKKDEWCCHCQYRNDETAFEMTRLTATRCSWDILLHDLGYTGTVYSFERCAAVGIVNLIYSVERFKLLSWCLPLTCRSIRPDSARAWQLEAKRENPTRRKIVTLVVLSETTLCSRHWIDLFRCWALHLVGDWILVESWSSKRYSVCAISLAHLGSRYAMEVQQIVHDCQLPWSAWRSTMLIVPYIEWWLWNKQQLQVTSDIKSVQFDSGYRKKMNYYHRHIDRITDIGLFLEWSA